MWTKNKKSGGDKDRWPEFLIPTLLLINLLCDLPRDSENSQSGGNVNQWDGYRSNSKESFGKA